MPYTDFGARHYSPALRRWLTPDPLSEKYYTSSPYAYCADNPINLVDPDGRTIRDKIAGILIGSATNVIPSTGFVRDLYSPQDSEDYNRALSISDNAAMIVAGGMISGGLGLIASGEAAQGAGALLAITGIGAEAGAVSFAGGAAISVTGGASVFIGSVMMASSLDNSKAGYNRGKPESSTTSSVKRGGESEAARIGREKHLQYNPGDGYKLNTALPSKKRPDAYNVDLGIVRELKPNNPRAIKKGQKQVEGYKKELQKLYPNKEWKAYVDTY